MDSWKNGDSGAYVRKVINNNFEALDKKITQETRTYILDFESSDWKSGTIFIEYKTYDKQYPFVELYIKTLEGYSIVYNGYKINENGIELQSDIAYDGRVVIR